MSKKILGIILTACIMMCLAGCGEEKIISEDYYEGNCGNLFMNSIMKMENGFYYSQGGFNSLSLHYYDAVNGKNMFLCNKPECRHDGNEFCAATSDKYNVMETVLYGGELYINVFEVTEKTFEYKLLKAALDGSALSEVVTYLTVDNVGIEPTHVYPLPHNMAIHRNKVFLPYGFSNENNHDISFTGTAIYDMDTGELSTLGEEEHDGIWIEGRFSGSGDYMYYVVAEKYKKSLFRYSYADGTVEKIDTVRGFQGVYTVYDEKKLYYYTAPKDIYSYDVTTKESRKINTKEWDMYSADNLSEIGYDVSDMVSDGEYLYICGNYDFHDYKKPATFIADDVMDKAHFYIVDREGNLINGFDFNTTELLGYSDYFTLHFMGEDIYLQTPNMVYVCSRESFVSGVPEFEEVYPMDIYVMSSKE